MGEVEAQAVGRDQRPGLAHVLAQDVAQLAVQNVGRGVVALDVHAPLHVDARHGGRAETHFAAGNLAVMDDHPGHGAAGVADGDLPGRLDRVIDDNAAVADLAARLDVEGRGSQHDLDLLTVGDVICQLAGRDQADHTGVRLDVRQVDVIDAAVGKLVQQREIGGQVAALSRRAELRGRSGALALRLQRLTVAGHVDGHVVLDGQVARQVQREAVGVPEAEDLVAGQLPPALGLQLSHPLLQHGQPDVQGAQEALLLVMNGVEDELGAVADLRVGVAHGLDDDLRHLDQEGFIEAQQLAEASGAAQHQPQDVVAPLVARQHAVADQKGDGARVVGDDAVGDDLRVALRVGVIQQQLHALHDRAEQVGVVVGLRALDHRDQPLQPHAGVDAGLRQQGPRAIGRLVVLHKHQVPDLQPALAAVVQEDAAIGPATGTELGAPVVVQLAGGAAGAGVAHGPEVGLLAHAQDALGRQADLVAPDAEGVVVVAEHRRHQPPAVDAVDAGQTVPGEVDRVALEVIAEGEVAQHLEEGVVARRRADLLQVVVLAADAHTLLAGGRAQIGALLQAQEGVFELHHAGVHEQQGIVTDGHQRRAGDVRVAVLLEVVEKGLADIDGGLRSVGFHAGCGSWVQCCLDVGLAVLGGLPVLVDRAALTRIKSRCCPFRAAQGLYARRGQMSKEVREAEEEGGETGRSLLHLGQTAEVIG